MTSAVVVGAGVFGAATARELDRRGLDVTLVEQYAPGNVRSGSGGDTRLLRFSHGEEDWYTLSARRSLELWLELEARGRPAPLRAGRASRGSRRADGDFTIRSEAALRRLGIPCERLTPEEARRLYPSLGGDDLRSVLFEPDAGVLYARRATQALARGLRVETRPRDAGRPARGRRRRLGLRLVAAGPLPGPRRAADLARATSSSSAPAASWAGTPGFCDYDGAVLRPRRPRRARDQGRARRPPATRSTRTRSSGCRLAANEQLAREYAARRFPSLAGAPIVGARVCQYDLTADTHFLVARHPERPDWWLVGGGSGHGFKHGPALAEYVADCVEGRREPEPFHALGPRGAGCGPAHGDHRGLAGSLGPEVLDDVASSARVVDPRRDDHELRVLGLVVPDRAHDLGGDPDRRAWRRPRPSRRRA